MQLQAYGVLEITAGRDPEGTLAARQLSGRAAAQLRPSQTHATPNLAQRASSNSLRAKGIASPLNAAQDKAGAQWRPIPEPPTPIAPPACYCPPYLSGRNFEGEVNHVARRLSRHAKGYAGGRSPRGESGLRTGF